MNELNIQKNVIDTFNIVFTQVKTRKEFTKELEELYNNHYKKNYEKDGFRKGEVPFKLAMENAHISSPLLEMVVRINKQLLVEYIVEELEESIYDITDGENTTDFAGFEIDEEEDVIIELNVELASFVEEVNYKDVTVDKTAIRAKLPTEEEFADIYENYKKMKEPVEVVGKDVFVDLRFDDGNDQTNLTFDLSKTPEDDELKIKTHNEIVEKVTGLKVGDEFEYELTGVDGHKLPVKVTVLEIYVVETVSDEEFLEIIREQSENKEITLEDVKANFRSHVEENYKSNLEEEIRGLTFESLRGLTTGIHYNEREIEDLRNQFFGQVSKMAEEDGVSYDEFVTNNFGSVEDMTKYVTLTQQLRVLQAAVYRKIGKSLEDKPTYPQLKSFVKTFILRVDPRETLTPDQTNQMDQQVDIILGEPLNRRRIIDGWFTARAEDVVTEIVDKQLV